MADLVRELARTRDCEAVIGERFPEINAYGSYGSPYVLDFVDDGQIERSALFLVTCGPGYVDDRDPSKNVEMRYEYRLMFAYRRAGDKSWSAQILPGEVPLMGLTLYFGTRVVDNRVWVSLSDGSKRSGDDIQLGKASVPVVMSGDTTTTFLVYYDGHWYQHIERDW